MTDQTATHRRAGDPAPPPGGLATGFAVFAGIMMLVGGGFQMLAGTAALIEDEFYVSTPNYVLQLDTTTWGWVHLLMGLLVLLAGFAVLSGRTWGRVVGIVLAVLSAFANFAFIPYYPLWSMIVIAVDVFVIWALAAHGRELAH